MDDSAQMNVLEVILVVGMLFMGLYFVRSMEVSSQSIDEDETRFETLGKSILINLASEPSSTGEYSSLLAEYIVDSDNYNYLTYFFNRSLPPGTMYKIEIADMSKMFHEGATLDDCKISIYEPVVWIQDEARVSRIVVADGNVYEIVVSLWFNLRS